MFHWGYTIPGIFFWITWVQIPPTASLTSFLSQSEIITDGPEVTSAFLFFLGDMRSIVHL